MIIIIIKIIQWLTIPFQSNWVLHRFCGLFFLHWDRFEFFIPNTIAACDSICKHCGYRWSNYPKADIPALKKMHPEHYKRIHNVRLN